MIFNRSHYEDVLVPHVNGWITPEQTRQRYRHINDFERMLTETGTVICKFLLHISKDEQRERLQERLDDPAKHWKFQLGDLEARKRWDDYQQAYSDAISRHWHQLGALDDRACRFEDPSQPDDRSHRASATAFAGPAFSGGRSGTRQDQGRVRATPATLRGRRRGAAVDQNL